MRSLTAAVAVLLLLAATGLAGCTGSQPAAPARLVIAAGGPDEVYRVLAEAFAESARREWSAQVEIASSRGSVENLRLVAEGSADVGFATVEAAVLATLGSLPFGSPLPLQALARLYDDYLQVVTLAEGDVATLADLAGRHVSIGAEGSGTDLVAERVLHAAEVRPDSQVKLGTGTSARALVAGEVDAFFVAGGLPTPAVTALADQGVAVRLLALSPQLVGDLQDQFGEYYLARSIPAGLYGIESEVETVSVPNVLVVRQDLPDDTAYLLTELLFAAKPELVAAHEEARRLDHRSALATYPIELHPGAQRYYRATKPLAQRGGQVASR